MAFLIQNWGRVSTSMNEPLVTLTDGTVSGAPREYSYYSADTQATMSASAYFNSVIYDLSVGDIIECYSATELTLVKYLVTSVTTNVTVSSAGGAQLSKSGTLTSAQFLGMYAAPIQLVAAPGDNRILLVNKLTLQVVFGTAQYAAGGAVGVQYDSTANAGGTAASATIAAASVNGVAATSSLVSVAGALAITGQATIVNKGLYLANATAAFTTGDGTFAYKLDYTVMTTS